MSRPFLHAVLSYVVLVLLFSAQQDLLCNAQISAAHLLLHRRGGAVVQHEPANLTHLSRVLRRVEKRYSRARREVSGNKLVRKWRAQSTGTTQDTQLLAEPGHDGKWYTDLPVGPRPGTIELDLDMLSPDFYTVQTTSGLGSQYNVFSKTHIPNDIRVHPLCKSPWDTIHLTDLVNTTSASVSFPTCSPPKSSRATLFPSGSVLGLSPSPSSSLSRLDSPSLLQQLVSSQALARDSYSLTLLDATSGVLSLGNTLARVVEEAKVRTQIEFDALGDPSTTTEKINRKIADFMASTFPEGTEDQFRWVPTRGAAEGWWTTLLQGLWINGIKVLKNQPVLLDIQCPFILAPPLAVRRFYESIGGCSRLPAPYEMFWKYPCLNPPKIMLEFGGWWFSMMSSVGSRSEALWGPDGGRLSLGKLTTGGKDSNSGYCVGRVLETRMGLKDQHDAEWEGSGLRDIWVLGEPTFWGLGIAFDNENQRIGFRNY